VDGIGVGEPEPDPPYGGNPDDGEKAKKYYVNDVPVKILSERVLYYDNDGRLITESLKDFTKKSMPDKYSSLDGFLKYWSAAEKKQAIVQELEEQGILLEALSDKVGKDYDPFDLICHVVFDQPPLSRRERAEQVKKRDVFTQYGDQARLVLEGLLEKYADEGLDNIESMNVLKLDPIKQVGTPMEIIKSFGGKDKYLKALQALEQELYSAA